MRGSGFLAIWSDVAAHDLTDYRHWLTREHTTERVTTRGFLASRVFRATRDDINRSSSCTSWKRPRSSTARPIWRASTRRRRGRSASCQSSAISCGAGAPWSRGQGGARGPRSWRCGSRSCPATRKNWPRRSLPATGSPPCRSERPTRRGHRCRRPKRACGRRGLLLRPSVDRGARPDSLQAALQQARTIAPDVLGRASEPEVYQTMFTLDARIADCRTSQRAVPRVPDDVLRRERVTWRP